MSTQVSAHASLIERFRVHLKTEEYSPSIQRSYPTLAQHFMDYCGSFPNVPLQTKRHHIPDDHRVSAIPVLGGLHHEYKLEKIAA